MQAAKLAELIGNAVGDGSLEMGRRHRFQLRGHETEDKEHYQKFIIPVFNEVVALPLVGKPVRTQTYHVRNSYGICIQSKAVVDFLRRCGLPTGEKKELVIPCWIKKNTKLLRPFLRGLFDTDGSVYCSRNYSSRNPHHTAIRLVFGTTSKTLCTQVYRSLVSLGFHPYMIKPFKSVTNRRQGYRVQISKKADVARWANKIGFTNTKHATKYAIWLKYGFCPPGTALRQRKDILKGRIDPESFYSRPA